MLHFSWGSWSHILSGHLLQVRLKNWRRTGHKLLRSRAQKRLQDNYLELEAYIRSNPAHDTYNLYGEAPKLVMSVEIFDISHFCDL